MIWSSIAASMNWTYEASFDHRIIRERVAASAPNAQMTKRCSNDPIIIARIDAQIIRSSFIDD